MMKKLLTIMMALVMIVTLSQCKKQNEENEENTAKVRISCTIPINKDSKTDFTNILNGEVNWSEETERIYLAIPATQKLVELTSTSEEGGATLTFTGSVQSGILENGAEYDVWYLGRGESKLNNGTLTGSIANQSGKLAELGDHHIAKTTVTAIVGDGITLTFNDTFENQIAIAHLDLTNVAGLSGEAIVGTDYSLEYIDGLYRLKVTGDKDINITGRENKNESYVVLFPTDKNAKDVELNSDSNKKMVFHNGIKQNTLYKENDNKPLIWELPEHECVDLGLTSGLKWATCNIGATTPEGYGNYYAWAEIETKTEYTKENSLVNTCGRSINDISGNERFDAAAANWGATWRMPKRTEYEELMTECTWDWTTQNDVNGYKVTGPNGNYIFLPAAGYINGTSSVNVGSHGYNWTSTPSPTQNKVIFCLEFSNGNKNFANTLNCHRGYSVRPVSGGNFEVPVPQYAPVTTAEISGITRTSAVCGGSVDADPYSSVTERGICWSINENPTISDNRTIDGSGNGVYTSNLTGLTTNTIYWVRAYATTAAGTSYGEQKPVRPQINSNGRSYVDLGLPSGLLWATCNVGANKPQDAGDRFAWGEVPGNDYNLDGIRIDNLYEQGYIDGGDNLTSQYDVATAKWGGAWKMPTSADYAELMDNCDWSWAEEEGIYGYKVTSKKDDTQYIFLPITEAIADSGLFFFYWTSSVTAVKDDFFGHAAKAIRLPNKDHSQGYLFSISIIDYARTSSLSVRPILL